MVKLIVIDASGAEHILDAEAGRSVEAVDRPCGRHIECLDHRIFRDPQRESHLVRLG